MGYATIACVFVSLQGLEFLRLEWIDCCSTARVGGSE